MRVVFTSTGTDRRREATFQITLVDGIGGSVVAGLVDVEAVHGNPVYILNVNPTAVNEVIPLPGNTGASATWTQQFTAAIQGGIGPFLYDWTTTVGTITAGQTTSIITLEQASGSMVAGQDKVFQGNLTCTVTDTGQGFDQIVKVVPVYLFFDNSVFQQSHTGTGALSSQAAQVVGVGSAIIDESIGTGVLTAQAAQAAGTGTLTPLTPVYTLEVIPNNINQSAQGNGVTTYSYLVSILLTANTNVPSGLISSYLWAATGWTITGQGTVQARIQRTFTCPVNSVVNYSGLASCSVMGLDIGGEEPTYPTLVSDITPITVTVINPSVKQIVTGSGAMRAQSAAAAGTGYKTEPSVMNVQILPSIIDIFDTGSTLNWSQLFTASRTGGVGPFTYQWSTTLGTFSGSTTNSTATLTFSMAAADGLVRIRTGTLTVAVTDTGRPGTSAVVDTCSLYFELDNSGGGGGIPP
jgi:hypothetical protein